MGTLLHELRKDEEAWTSLAKKAVVRLYSGQFNINGMKEEDMEFITETAKLNPDKPLVDVAHYVYTGRWEMLQRVKNLCALFVTTL